MSKRIAIATIVIATITVVVLAALMYWRQQEGDTPQKASEAVLRQDLFALRDVIDQYTADKTRPPRTLQDLVTAGYLKEIPVDPFTERRDTWVVVKSTDEGIEDVHSGSSKKARDGTKYSDW